MNFWIRVWLVAWLVGWIGLAHAQTVQKTVDIPTRAGVTQRFLLLTPVAPKAAVILMAGGNGGLQIDSNGSMRWGGNNFLVRTRQMFADQGFLVAVVDAPSDRQGGPFLSGFRQTPEHVEDIKSVIAWIRTQSGLPVWLVGTSRGTQSAAFVGIALSGAGGPDGLVLTSSILVDPKGRSVNAMRLSELHIPVLVVHHEQDGCKLCPFQETGTLMEQLTNAPRKELLSIKGGDSFGDPCEGRAHHGFNGLDSQVVAQMTAWMLRN